MQTRRINACLIIKDGWVVQSIGFRRYLPVGRPEVTVEFLNAWGLDEIILLDISATAQGRAPDFDLVSRVSRHCFVPLAVGGGLATVEDMRRVIRSGADKVVVNTAALRHPELITEAARVLGNQCVVVAIDVGHDEAGTARVYSHADRRIDSRSVVDYAREVERRGAGEILLTSVDRDGAKTGFDTALVRSVADAVNIEVIAVGGAGHPAHFEAVFQEGHVNAAAAGNFFHFSEHSVIATKQYLRTRGVDVRIDTQASYAGAPFDALGRAGKLPDAELYHRQFSYHPEERI